ncbi:MAG: hypothetical protein ACOCZ6_02805 [Nanoarchaeota archaeon]
MYKRIVEKFGSAYHFGHKGEPDYETMEKRVREIEKDMDNGLYTIVTASGAVAFGMRETGEKRPKSELTLAEKQKYAAIGENELLNFYKKISNKPVAGILFSIHDLYHSKSIKGTLESCIEDSIVVVNRNDPTDLLALKAGYEHEMDNDMTAAWLLSLCDANLLIKRCRYDGFMNNGHVIPEIPCITQEHWDYCNGTTSLGTGGGESTLNAAQYVIENNKKMVIGNVKHSRDEILQNEVKATWIPGYEIK